VILVKQFNISPGGALTGTLRVPGDKSISHRSMMLGSLAQGRSTVSGLLQGEDVLSTMRAFQQMGVRIEATLSGDWEVWGNGLQGLQKPGNALDLGNSGTSMRLMSGILAAQPFAVTLTGDHSLSKRPMQRVLTPLAKMGATIQSAENGRPPLVFSGNQQLMGIDYALPVASAQVKSAILLAGLYASGTTRITEPALLRDHTERMLQGMGVALQVDGSQITLPSGRRELRPISIDVPADISSAAFFLVGASIAKGSDLLLEHVGINPSRIGVMNILKLMGADIEVINERQCSGEPVADLRVRYAPLQGIRIPVEQVPLAIDEFPVLFIAAACASGQTVLTGAEELRVKESDRIQSMADGLQQLGVQATVQADGIIIEGGDGFLVNELGRPIQAYSDHRIAMAFAVAGLRANANIVIDDCDNVATSFPNFIKLSEDAGLSITEKNKGI